MKPRQVLPVNSPVYNDIIWGGCWLVMEADLDNATARLCGGDLVKVAPLSALTKLLYLTAETVQPIKCLSLQ